MKVKYEIEKQAEKKSRTLIYTTKTRANLKFIREYCETNGCVEIKYLDHYIKKKVNENLNLNLNIPKEELISAAKVSVGKDKTYWMDLSHKGSSIFLPQRGNEHNLKKNTHSHLIYFPCMQQLQQG